MALKNMKIYQTSYIPHRNWVDFHLLKLISFEGQIWSLDPTSGVVEFGIRKPAN